MGDSIMPELTRPLKTTSKGSLDVILEFKCYIANHITTAISVRIIAI